MRVKEIGVLKYILRWVASAGRAAQEKLSAIETREAVSRALLPGTKVRLGSCPCNGSDHGGDWEIVEYIPDADDYKIFRRSDGKTDYAAKAVLIVIEPEEAVHVHG